MLAQIVSKANAAEWAFIVATSLAALAAIFHDSAVATILVWLSIAAIAFGLVLS